MLYAENNKILYKMHLAKMEAELQPLKIGVQQMLFSMKFYAGLPMDEFQRFTIWIS